MRRSDGVLLIAAGGGVGAVIRYLVDEALPSASFPWSTFVVNIVGCALLAVVTSPTQPKGRQRVLGTGFCGGLTTFSTFSVEIASLTNDGRPTLAITYLLLSLALGLAAFTLVRRQLQPGPPTPSWPA